MRHLFFLACLVLLLGLAVPAQAQLRADLPNGHAPVRLFDNPAASFLLNNVFSPEHFRMGHSYEMSFGSAGSMGMYTNSMMWQFNEKLAARVDLAYAFSPFGGGNFFGSQDNNSRFLLRNAEINYRPSENVHLHLSFQQNPYGYHMSPYGYYGSRWWPNN
jgi:hypothetical protein